MKFLRFIAVLALSAGLMASCGEKDAPDLTTADDALTVSPAAAKISAAGNASFTFTFSLVRAGETLDLNHYVATINFEGVNGTVSPASATTDGSGKVSVTFTTPNPESFTGGSVKGTVVKVVGDKTTSDFLQQGSLATATAQVLPLDAEEPGGEVLIEEAEKLPANKYVVKKTGGDTKTYDFYSEGSNWYRSTQNTGISLMFTDEKEVVYDGEPILMTNGMGRFVLPEAIVNKLQKLNKEFFQQYPWAEIMFHNYDEFWMTELSSMIGVKVGTDGQGNAHGNMKLNGSSGLLIKEKGAKSGYEGQYEVLFVFVFNNMEHDPETGNESEGSEYTIYGHAVLDHVVPELDWVNITSKDKFLVTGKSTVLNAEYTDGAVFDWNKLELTGQYKGGSEGTWFSFDKTNHTVKAETSADNQQVTLRFSYPGITYPLDVNISTGPGWPYTSFSVQPTELTAMRNTRTGFTVSNWSPKEGSAFEYTPFDYNALEIDYDYEGATSNIYYYYNEYTYRNLLIGWGTKPGNYNIRLRSRSNHDVAVTIPIKVKDFIDSFTIKPHEFYLGYGGSGQVLDVEYEPETTPWDWYDLEIDPDYGDKFIYYPASQKIAINTLASGADAHVLGVQVKFRLKSNHNIYDYVYVNMNQQPQ